MSKLEITFAESSEGGVVFVDPKSGKGETILYEHAIEKDKALDALKKEIGQRANVTRAALSVLVQILAMDRVSGYMGKGQGTLGQEGAGVPTELKAASREAESAFFAPMFKDNMALDKFLAGLREAGPYAVVKGVCLKYFWFLGKLPCAYNAKDGTPDQTRLLAVSAMQKLLKNATPDADHQKTFGDRVADLMATFVEKKAEAVKDIKDADGLIARLKQFLDEATQWKNELNVMATKAHESGVPMALIMKATTEADPSKGTPSHVKGSPVADPTPEEHAAANEARATAAKGKGKQKEKAKAAA